MANEPPDILPTPPQKLSLRQQLYFGVLFVVTVGTFIGLLELFGIRCLCHRLYLSQWAGLHFSAFSAAYAVFIFLLSCNGNFIRQQIERDGAGSVEILQKWWRLSSASALISSLTLLVLSHPYATLLPLGNYSVILLTSLFLFLRFAIFALLWRLEADQFRKNSKQILIVEAITADCVLIIWTAAWVSGLVDFFDPLLLLEALIFLNVIAAIIVGIKNHQPTPSEASPPEI